MTHPTVKVSGYEIPLIGLPTGCVLQECGLCRDLFPLDQVQLNEAGTAFYCRICRNHVHAPMNTPQIMNTEPFC